MERPLRVAEFAALFATAVRPAERSGPTELRVHLPGGEDTAATARDLIGREAGCCTFFSFRLRAAATGTGATGTELDVRVPGSRIAVLDALQEQAEAARTGAGT